MRDLRIWTPAILCGALILSGCPFLEGENNRTQNNSDVPTDEDMSSSAVEDMPADIEPDMRTDGPKQDMAPAVVADCEVASFAPRTLPIGASIADIELILECDGDLEEGGEVVEAKIESARGSRDGTLTGIQRRDLRDDVRHYSVQLTGASSSEEGDEPGLETITVTSSLGEWALPLRWHLPVDVVDQNETPRAILPLPRGYKERGLGARVMKVGDKPMMFGAMVSEANDAIDIFWKHDASSADVSSTASIEAIPSDIAVQQFDVFRLGDGELHAVWWGWDAGKKNFTGAIIKFDATGLMREEQTLGAMGYTGPEFARILDASPTLRGGEEKQFVTVEILAKTTEGKLVSLQLFDKGTDEVNVTRTIEKLEASETSKFSDAMLRLVRVGYDSPGSASAPSMVVALDAVSRKLIWSATSGDSKETALPIAIDFTPTELFVGAAGDGKSVFALVHGGKDERALFNFAISPEVDRLDPIELPGSIDLRPARQDHGVHTPDFGFYTGAGQLSIAQVDGQATMLGRWPWNWRDKLGATEQRAQGRWPWDWRERKGLRASTNFAARWDAAGKLTNVYPITVDREVRADAGATIVTGLADAGAALAISATNLDPSACADFLTCAVSVSQTTDWRGGAFLLGPGVNGPTYAFDKYGDILIDGVPLEFDLIGPIFMLGAGAPGSDPTDNLAIAPIAHPDATHALWTIDQSGVTSGPVPVTFDFGEIDGEVDLGAGIQGGAIVATSTDPNKPERELVLDFAVKPRADARDPKPRRATTSSRYDRAVQAVIDGKLATIDVSSPPPFVDTVDDSLRYPEDGTGAPEFWLPAPSELFDARGDLLLDAHSGGEERSTTTLAELTPEQLTRPLVFRTEADGQVALYSKPAGSNELQRVAFIGDKEVLLNIGFKLGDGTPQVFSLSYGVFSGRIKRIKIKKKRVGSGFQLPEGATVELEEITVPLPALTSFGESFTCESWDVNGDGLDDEIIRGGYVDNVELRYGTTLVLFSDGLGGYLPGQWVGFGAPSSGHATISDNGKKGVPKGKKLDRLQSEQIKLSVY